MLPSSVLAEQLALVAPLATAGWQASSARLSQQGGTWLKKVAKRGRDEVQVSSYKTATGMWSMAWGA